ncbi:MAG: amidohydrolase [Coriobacteriia bacterium]|nr:amidohydrolase [Coriobacteriia bacterium]MBS5478846.1 amidohydrolase [Coriobacteriia bacterium]
MPTIFTHADFVPMTGQEASFEAMLVTDGGTIAYTGPLKEARAQASEFGGAAHAEEVSLDGLCVLPGFIDAHSHFTGVSQYFTSADLSGATSFPEIAARLRAFAKRSRAGAGDIILGTNYDHNDLAERRHPDRHLLDEVSADVPVAIIHASSHQCVANTKLLELAGLSASTADPTGGRYGREADGTLSGYCEEPAAMWPVLAIVQERQHTGMDKLLAPMQNVYLEQGITTCQDGATTADMADELDGAARAGKLVMDVVAYPMYGEDIDAMFAEHATCDTAQLVPGRTGYGPFGTPAPAYANHLRFGGVKMFLDGSPQGRTAWLSRPYTPGPEGDGYRGYPTMSDADALAFARTAVNEGRQLLAHVNGDAALERFLAVYARALADATHPRKRELRPVAIHTQIARRDQIERMGMLNMVPSVFASHIWYWGDTHLRNLGRARAMRISACADMLDCWLPLTLHCDTPVLRPNLLEAVWCAAERRTKVGVHLGPTQSISVYEGLRAITANAAYQYGEESRKGTLEPGKLADFIVLSDNPLRVEPDRLRSIRVLTTYKEGRPVWRA